MDRPSVNRVPDRGEIKRIIQGCAFLIIEIALFFLAAGRTDLPRAWLYFLLYALMLLSDYLLLKKYSPGLIEERGQLIEGTKQWDLAILLLFAILQILSPAVAGYDLGHLHFFDLGYPYLLAGIILYVVGASIATWSMASNRFFASTVVVQKSQKVVSSGPYAYIRHPGYAGILLMTIAFPLIVGSSLAFLPAVIVVILFFVRTLLEDNTLQKELIGYKDYAKRVRARLVPWIW